MSLSSFIKIEFKNSIFIKEERLINTITKQKKFEHKTVSLAKQLKCRYEFVAFTWGLPFFPWGLLWPKLYMDVPARPRKSDFLYTNFLPNFPPISIPFSKEKHPILTKLGAFYNNFLQIHPIDAIWAPSSLMKPPRSLYHISRKRVPKGRHIYVYHVNVRTPPRAFSIHVSKVKRCSHH